MAEGLRVGRRGWLGLLTLDRPRALNALTAPMMTAMAAALAEFAAAPSVGLVVLASGSARAFCAGGEIREVYEAVSAGDMAGALARCQAEYDLDRAIARFPKPLVALVDGLAMGGGIGISAHASHCVVTERARLSAPECAIGLAPDSGLSALLAGAPGRLGEYLALTGAAMGPADAIAAGFARHFLPASRIPALVDALALGGRPDLIARYCADPGPAPLLQRREAIDRIFSAGSLAGIRARLTRDRTPFAGAALAAIDRASPLSLAAALALVRRARARPGLDAALRREFRVVAYLIAHGDFMEGVRAAVLDRDRRPNWRYPGGATVPEPALRILRAALSEPSARRAS